MGPDPPLSIRAESRNSVARVALIGELDLATAPHLEEHLSGYEGDGVATVLVDLRDLAFMDSTGLRAFLRAHQRAEASGRRFLLVGVSPNVRRVFETTRTEFLLDGSASARILERFAQDGARAPAEASAREVSDS